MDEPTIAKPARPLRRRLGRVVLLYVVTPYIAIIVLFTVSQRSIIYRPTVDRSYSSKSNSFDLTHVADVEMRVSHDVVVRGWLFTPSGEPSESNPLVIYFGGNGGNRFTRYEDLREIANAGFDVLIFDYRGYGNSDGHATEANLTHDARAAWKFATTQRRYPPEQVVLFGESLGGAVALSLWDRGDPQPAAVILNSTFTSMSNVAADTFPAFPFGYCVFDRWPSIERIASVASPVTVFHGTGDELISVDHGRRLAKAAPRGSFVEIKGGSHNEIPAPLLKEHLTKIRRSIIEHSAHSKQ